MPQRLLRVGIQGADVKQLQGCLNLKVHFSQPSTNNALPRLTPDGIFGIRTEAKLKEFQRREQLAADGIAGPVTYGALFTRAPYWNSSNGLGTQDETVKIASPWGQSHTVILSRDGTRAKGIWTHDIAI